ncbi:MAG: DUF4194 domain-containing protein [Actinomycetota bacterium]|jgi:hypothetical protein|nr:DUF4194 domain-containing protein [Actinomycetota bacterium]
MSVTSSGEAQVTDLAVAVVHLMKGPVYQDANERVWRAVMSRRREISDYVSVIGLETVVDEAEGYAFLRSRPVEDDEPEMPRLVARRTLSFHTSLLLVLLRKRLVEFDASSSDARLVLTRDQIVEMLRLYFPDSTNEAKLVDGIDAHISRVAEMGFLHKMRGEEDTFEVRRIIKAFVDGQWLGDFDRRLEEYIRLVAGADTSREADAEGSAGSAGPAGPEHGIA